MSPRVSVVIPTHGRPKELQRALRSVAAQTVQDFEVIVVDDGSSTPVTLEPGLAHDARFRVLRHDVSYGVATARNDALEVAAGEWIAFLDDDDVWRPEKLEWQLRQAELDGGGFLFSSSVILGGHRHVIAPLPAPRTDDLVRALLTGNVVGPPSTVLARRKALDDAGPFDRRLAILADWDMWLRLAQATEPSVVRTPTTIVLDHQGSMQATLGSTIRHELAIMQSNHAELVARTGVELDVAWADLWLANKRWKIDRSLPSWLAYLRTMARTRGVTGVAKTVGMRVVRRYTPAPAWASTLMDELDRPASTLRQPETRAS